MFAKKTLLQKRCASTLGCFSTLKQKNAKKLLFVMVTATASMTLPPTRALIILYRRALKGLNSITLRQLPVKIGSLATISSLILIQRQTRAFLLLRMFVNSRKNSSTLRKFYVKAGPLVIQSSLILIPT